MNKRHTKIVQIFLSFMDWVEMSSQKTIGLMSLKYLVSSMNWNLELR